MLGTRIATHNVRGLSAAHKRTALAACAKRANLHVIALQETMCGRCHGERYGEYALFCGDRVQDGTGQGVGFLVHLSVQIVSFASTSPRIASLIIETPCGHFNIFSLYAMQWSAAHNMVALNMLERIPWVKRMTRRAPEGPNHDSLIDYIFVHESMTRDFCRTYVGDVLQSLSDHLVVHTTWNARIARSDNRNKRQRELPPPIDTPDNEVETLYRSLQALVPPPDLPTPTQRPQHASATAIRRDVHLLLRNRAPHDQIRDARTALRIAVTKDYTTARVSRALESRRH